MAFRDIVAQAKASAERAAVNDAKQKILFHWHRSRCPARHNVFCHAETYSIHQKAVTELNDKYCSTIFNLCCYK